MDNERIDLGDLTDFPEGRPVLKKQGRWHFVCVRDGDVVHALDDRCPHQGYPLSQGCVAGGILTCEWHNWKFDLATGACTFGGEAVRRYPTCVVNGRVELDPAIDAVSELRRLERSVKSALVDGSPGRALREALRIGAVAGPHERLGTLARGFALLAQDGAERAEYGFDHPLALLADACTWVEQGWIAAEDAFAACATAVGETSLHRGPRARTAVDVSEPDDAAHATDDLVHERRDAAETRVRSLVRAHGAEVAARSTLVPFVARHVYDYGHGAIFLSKALELAHRFPDAAEELLGAVTASLAWATAETALPPFAATRAALETLAAPPSRRAELDRARVEKGVLAGERPALEAARAELDAGADPVEVLRAIAHAAAVRLSRFDRAWETRLDAEVTVLDVTHAVTYAEANLALAAASPPVVAARLAMLAAGFIGKLHRADGAPPVPGTSGHASLADAARARDLGSALAIARELAPSQRSDQYPALAPFAAFEAATRPIFYVHMVKTTEALCRLERADPEADGAYLEACLALLVPPPRERSFRRTSFIASKFLADGRPPVGLY